MSMTLAIILGNRDFFPDALITEARRDLSALFAKLDIKPIWLSEAETKLGAVETWQDAVKCGGLFRDHAASIDGILVCLPNFSDEKGIADSIRLSELHVPILVQACPDDLDAFGLTRRRDAFCGKISACNNLRQYGYKYTLTRNQTLSLRSTEFAEDLTSFLATCRVTRGLRRVRLGAVGARPNAFNTTRFSEKLLEGPASRSIRSTSLRSSAKPRELKVPTPASNRVSNRSRPTRIPARHPTIP